MIEQEQLAAMIDDAPLSQAVVGLVVGTVTALALLSLLALLDRGAGGLGFVIAVNALLLVFADLVLVFP